MPKTLYQSIFDEGFAQGYAEGLAGVKDEDIARAYAEGMIFVLGKRFGLGAVLNRRIRKETRLEVLDSWIDEMAKAPDLQALVPLIERIHRTPPPQSE